jgi:hypothetical protein
MPLFHDVMPLLIKKRGAMYCRCALFHFFHNVVSSTPCHERVSDLRQVIGFLR